MQKSKRRAQRYESGKERLGSVYEKEGSKRVKIRKYGEGRRREGGEVEGRQR